MSELGNSTYDKWKCVSCLYVPCDGLATCSGCTSPLTQCQLGLAPAPHANDKDKGLCIMDGWKFVSLCQFNARSTTAQMIFVQ